MTMIAMPNADTVYLDALEYVLIHGAQKMNRTGVGTFSTPFYTMKFDLTQGFPLLTTKKVFWKGVVEELFWFIRGSTNVKDLQERGVTIWDEWADENGDLGPIYGKQWRCWEGLGPAGQRVVVDQLAELINGLRQDPNGRRHIVTAWNPVDLPRQRLPPCHAFMQMVVEGSTLHCGVHQRSADIFLGVPFNIASYALLTRMVAHLTGFLDTSLTMMFGDLHLYHTHYEAAKTQLARRNQIRPSPAVSVVHRKKTGFLTDFAPEDVFLHEYKPHPAISAPIAV